MIENVEEETLENSDISSGDTGSMSQCPIGLAIGANLHNIINSNVYIQGATATALCGNGQQTANSDDIWSERVWSLEQFWTSAFALETAEIPEYIRKDLTENCEEKIILVGWFPNENVRLVNRIKRTLNVPYRLVTHPSQNLEYGDFRINSLVDLIGLEKGSVGQITNNFDNFHLNDCFSKQTQTLFLENLLDLELMGVINKGGKNRSYLASRIVGIKNGLNKNSDGFIAFAVKNQCIQDTIEMIEELRDFRIS